jgi:hypothetical protein
MVINTYLSLSQIPLHSNTVITVKNAVIRRVSALVHEVQTIPSSFSSRWLTITDLFAKVMALAEEGGLSASNAGEMYSVSKYTARAWLQKYQVCVSWKTQGNWVMARIQPSSGCCVSS